MSDELPSLDDLSKSIKEAKLRAEGEKTPQKAGAAQICADLVAGVAVGAFIGYWIDKWLDTSPWFFISCFVLGVAGSGLNIYRSVMKQMKDE